MLDELLRDNWFAIASALFSAGGIYKLFKYRLDKHSDRICRLEDKTGELTELRTDIKWIKSSIDDIKKKLENL